MRKQHSLLILVLILLQIVSCKGKPSSGVENGHEYVDLGLSVKWATCNIGASSPEDKGDEFAWGETTTKQKYSSNTYKFYRNKDEVIWGIKALGLTKYNVTDWVDKTDNKRVLDKEDDAAYVNWGNNWHTPTIEEFNELIDKCSWQPTTINGIQGYKITSKVKGYTNNSIFLPSTITLDELEAFLQEEVIEVSQTDRDFILSGGTYWTSSINTEEYPDGAWQLIMDNTEYEMQSDYRFHGNCIRPVLNKKISKVSSSTSNNIEALNNQKPSTEDKVAKIVDSHEYVDLGLSVKWATCNVGASRPEDFGDYYAWGEIRKKIKYTWDNYSFRKSGKTENDVVFNKYNTIEKYGIIDNKTTLELKDDVAQVLWGGNWKIPTRTEFEELYDSNKCEWTWVEMNGVEGYRITSKIDGYIGNYIFLPAAGMNQKSKSASLGHYWTATLDYEAPINANKLTFGKVYTSFGNIFPDEGYRLNGYSVRPVCP